MRNVTIRLRLELIDEDNFNTDWIEDIIQEHLVDNERVIDFVMEDIKSIYTHHPTQHDESDDIEAGKTATITPHGTSKSFNYNISETV
jgi:hypothetical protein